MHKHYRWLQIGQYLLPLQHSVNCPIICCYCVRQTNWEYHQEYRLKLMRGKTSLALIWMTVFIQQLLIVTHKQWVYWNTVVLHWECGHIVAQEKENLQQDIDTQLQMGATGLLTADFATLQHATRQFEQDRWGRPLLLAFGDESCPT